MYTWFGSIWFGGKCRSWETISHSDTLC